jgi:hypothetical protein
MNFKYSSGLTLAIATLLISCGGTKHSRSSAVLPGTWQSQPVVIDGDSKDWPSPYPNYDAKGKVAYATSNDKQYLYITVETGDELTQMKMLKQGMTVSIDTTGKKETKFNINYPLPNDNDPSENIDILKETKYVHVSKQWQQKVDKLSKDATQFSLDGFGSCNGGFLINQTTPCGIKVRMAMDEYKELVWEAAIPFKAIYGKDNITAADAGKPISVCFAIKGFKHPSSKSEDNSGGGGMNSGMGNAGMGPGSGRHNSSMGGGGRGRAMTEDPMQHLYENTKTWKIFGVAYQQ